MYRVANQNIEKRSNARRALDDAKIAGKGFWKIFRIVWIGLVIIVMSFWILALLIWLTGGEVIPGL